MDESELPTERDSKVRREEAEESARAGAVEANYKNLPVRKVMTWFARVGEVGAGVIFLVTMINWLFHPTELTNWIVICLPFLAMSILYTMQLSRKKLVLWTGFAVMLSIVIWFTLPVGEKAKHAAIRSGTNDIAPGPKLVVNNPQGSIISQGQTGGSNTINNGPAPRVESRLLTINVPEGDLYKTEFELDSFNPPEDGKGFLIQVNPPPNVIRSTNFLEGSRMSMSLGGTAKSWVSRRIIFWTTGKVQESDFGFAVDRRPAKNMSEVRKESAELGAELFAFYSEWDSHFRVPANQNTEQLKADWAMMQARYQRDFSARVYSIRNDFERLGLSFRELTDDPNEPLIGIIAKRLIAEGREAAAIR
jgi:hypothetical protein